MSCCTSNNNESISILNKTREAAVCAQTNCASAEESAEAAALSAYAAAVSAGQSAASAALSEIYLGPKATAPTTDNDGGPLQEGMQYFNTTDSVLYIWNGTAWQSSAFNEFTNFTATGTTTARNLVTRAIDIINVKDFGAVADGVTDNTSAFQSAINFCGSNKKSLHIPGGRYYFDGGKLTVNSGIVIFGDGKDNSVLVFGGTPVKETITRITWSPEYNSGDYTNNSDSPIAWGIRVFAQNAILRDFSIITNEDASINYPLPFSSYTNYPKSNYDYGIIVQRENVLLHGIRSAGVWSDAALILDGSNVGGFGDGFNAYDCDIFGFWGLKIVGAQGQPLGGNNYNNLTSLDTRSSAGLSDVNIFGTNIGDTSCHLRLFINGIKKGVRQSDINGGALYINGQVFQNTAKRIQGHRFYGCRFASSNPYVYFLNYVNRVEFLSCHSEYRFGFYGTDGVTLLTANDCKITVTENSRKVVYFGGEKSGESDDRTFNNLTDNVQIINEYGYDNTTRRLTTDKLSIQSTWIPRISAAIAGTPTYATQYGYYTRVGDLVCAWGRITLSSKGGISGNLTIEGLPFTVANLNSSYDPSVTFGAVSQVTASPMGGVANNNTKTIALLKMGSGSTLANLSDSDITDSSRMDFSCYYITSEA